MLLTKLKTAFCATAMAGMMLYSPAMAASRIKDIVDVEGVRSNQLIGYGIVVGLAGTGDTVRNSPMVKQSMESMLERLGVNIRDAQLNTKNVAAVMVTGELTPFGASGSRIDVTVSAMGDAKSLLGGTLLVTPSSALMAKPMPWPRAPSRLVPSRRAALQARLSPGACPPPDALLRAARSSAKRRSTSIPCRSCA